MVFNNYSHLYLRELITQNFHVHRVSLRIGETGEYWKVTGELLWKGKALSRNKQNLAGEFCVVSGEFSDLRCLMNTL